jgi:hypothetical protein
MCSAMGVVGVGVGGGAGRDGYVWVCSASCIGVVREGGCVLMCSAMGVVGVGVGGGAGRDGGNVGARR